MQPLYKTGRSFRVAESSSALVKASSVKEDASGLGRIAELAKFNAVGQGLAGDPEAQRGDYRAAGVVGVLVEIVGKAVRLFFGKEMSAPGGGG